MQLQDLDLSEMLTYLETGILPAEENRASRVALTASQYVAEDRILYRVESDGSLRLITPASQHRCLFEEAHGGVFRAHLSDTKVYSE